MHYDGEPERRVEYRRFVGDGMRGGYAADDGAALHFAGARAARPSCSSRRDRRAYRVEVHDDEVVETPLEARYLGLDEPVLAAA